MTTEHPLPWSAERVHPVVRQIIDADGEPVIQALFRRESKVLDLILRAVNNHEALVESLKNLLAANAVYRKVEDEYIQSDEEGCDLVTLEDAAATVIIRENEAFAAIARAEGGVA